MMSLLSFNLRLFEVLHTGKMQEYVGKYFYLWKIHNFTKRNCYL